MRASGASSGRGGEGNVMFANVNSTTDVLRVQLRDSASSRVVLRGAFRISRPVTSSPASGDSQPLASRPVHIIGVSHSARKQQRHGLQRLFEPQRDLVLAPMGLRFGARRGLSGARNDPRVGIKAIRSCWGCRWPTPSPRSASRR